MRRNLQKLEIAEIEENELIRRTEKTHQGLASPKERNYASQSNFRHTHPILKLEQTTGQTSKNNDFNHFSQFVSTFGKKEELD